MIIRGTPISGNPHFSNSIKYPLYEFHDFYPNQTVFFHHQRASARGFAVGSGPCGNWSPSTWRKTSGASKVLWSCFSSFERHNIPYICIICYGNIPYVDNVGEHIYIYIYPERPNTGNLSGLHLNPVFGQHLTRNLGSSFKTPGLPKRPGQAQDNSQDGSSWSGLVGLIKPCITAEWCLVVVWSWIVINFSCVKWL